MIRAGTAAVAKLVDRLKLDNSSYADISHLVDVRPLRRSEIPIVTSRLNPARNETTHQARLQLQNDGMLVYLIAWIDDEPVGHGMILWDGPTGSPKQHLAKIHPYVEDLWVRKELRSRGIGARILAEISLLSIAHGFDTISLSVGTDNSRAIRLYKRMGFVTTAIPKFTLSGIVSVANGETQFWSERCQYMLKPLANNKHREQNLA